MSDPREKPAGAAGAEEMAVATNRDYVLREIDRQAMLIRDGGRKPSMVLLGEIAFAVIWQSGGFTYNTGSTQPDGWYRGMEVVREFSGDDPLKIMVWSEGTVARDGMPRWSDV